MSVIPTVSADGVGTIAAGQLNAYEISCYNTGVLRTIVGQTGMTVFLQGINTPNDGGQGNFYWDYTSTATDNNSTVIRPYGVVYGAWLKTLLPSYNVFTTVETVNVINPSGTINNLVLDAAGDVTVGADLTITGAATAGGIPVVAVDPGTSGNVLTSNGSEWVSQAVTQTAIAPLNRLINGDMAVDQRNNGVPQTITAGAALAYTVDRWYAYCTGVNVTGQQVTGATANQYRYKFTGASGVTAIGFGQRIQAANCADMAGKTITWSVDLANSLLTSITWTAYYANTTDNFGTLASPTVTQIATGTFTISSTINRYSTQVAIPSSATTGIQFVFTVGAQNSGTWTIGDVQWELGLTANAYQRQIYSDQLAQCQYYYQTTIGYQITAYNPSSSTVGVTTASIQIPSMRITPDVTPSAIIYSSGSASGLTLTPVSTNAVQTYFTIPGLNSAWCSFTYAANAEL